MLEVGIRRVEHHADESDGLERWPQACHVWPQTSDIVGRRQYRTPDIDATLHVRVIVGVQRGDEFDRGIAFEEFDHVWPMTQKRLDRHFVETVAGFVTQVGERRRLAVVYPMPVARHPQHATGKRRCAAEAVILFDDDHLQAVHFCGDRRRQATGARAHHQYVAAARLHVRTPSKPGRGINAMGMLSSPPSTVSSAPLM
ncbi:hypothetical protein D3C81_1483660 [compost metagenome]